MNRERERERDAAWDAAEDERRNAPAASSSDDRRDDSGALRGGYSDSSGGGGGPPNQQRMTLQLSDAAYKLTGRAKPAPPPQVSSILHCCCGLLFLCVDYLSSLSDV